MKKLLLILLTLLTFSGYAQFQNAPNPKLLVGNSFYFCSTDSTVWLYMDMTRKWVNLTTSKKLVFKLDSVINNFYSKSQIDTKLGAKSDTSYRRLNNLLEKSYNSLTDKPTIPDFSTKLNISDTTGMLSHYQTTLNNRVKVADTATMLTHYAKTITVNNSLASKVNYSDTASLLNRRDPEINYRIKVSDTTAMFTNYKTNINNRLKWSDSTFLNKRDAVINSKMSHNDSTASDGYVRRDRLTSSLATKINNSTIGANNGVAPLDAGGKISFSYLPSSLYINKGTWSASVNSPTLANGTGVNGWVYQSTTAGTVNFGAGNITFAIGDYAGYNGTIWQWAPGTNSVRNVNGQQGIVTLTTDNINEGSTNLYFTQLRARNSYSGGSGISVNPTTGVIGNLGVLTETDPTIYTWAKAISKPSYNSGEVTESGNLYFTDARARSAQYTASSTVTGLLSAADWNTFNNKISGNQSITLSGDATGTGSTAISVIVKKINGISVDDTPPTLNDFLKYNGSNWYHIGIDKTDVGLSNVTNNAQWYSGNHPTTLSGYGITDTPWTTSNTSGSAQYWNGMTTPSSFIDTGVVDKLAGGLSGAGDIVWLRASRIQSFLGLGSNAYTSYNLQNLGSGDRPTFGTASIGGWSFNSAYARFGQSSTANNIDLFGFVQRSDGTTAIGGALTVNNTVTLTKSNAHNFLTFNKTNNLYQNTILMQTGGVNDWEFGSNSTSSDLYFYSYGTGYTVFNLSKSTGTATFSSLSGTGTRMVVADNSGVISTQAIPSGGGGGLSSVSINNANGFYGSSTGGSSPVLDIKTSVTGILQGNGTGVTAASSANIITALGYTPYNSTNPSSYITGITSGNVTTALGYTPYNASNPNGYITTYTETDPNVSAWAKSGTKPSYTYSEVGAIRNSTSQQTSANFNIDGNGVLAGSITAYGGGFSSLRSLKNIHPDWVGSATEELMKFHLRIFNYKPRPTIDTTAAFIIDEIPQSIAKYILMGVKKDAINIYSLHGFEIKAIQELALKDKAKDKRIAKLEKVVYTITHKK